MNKLKKCLFTLRLFRFVEQARNWPLRLRSTINHEWDFSSWEFDHWRHFRTSGEIGVLRDLLIQKPMHRCRCLESQDHHQNRMFCESTRYQLVVTLLGRNRLILKMILLPKVNSDSVRVGVLFWWCAEVAQKLLLLSSRLALTFLQRTLLLLLERDEIWRWGVGPMCLGQKECVCVWFLTKQRPFLYKLLHTRVTRFTKTCFCL